MSDESCAEFRRSQGFTRRTLLKGLGVAGAATLVSTEFGTAFRQAAFAAEPVDRVLVLVSLRGGIDGLGLVVPHGDPAYATARPTIALPTSTLLARDDLFGLHPSLAPLSSLWEGGEMAAVHAVGATTVTRSHFLAMEQIEEAAPGSASRTGWVNRMIGLDEDREPVAAVQIGNSRQSALLSGPASALATRRIADLGIDEMAGDGTWARRRRRQLELSWSAPGSPFANAGRQAMAVADAAQDLGGSRTAPASYPSDVYGRDLGEALADTARLIRADVGAQVVTVDHGTWDMHSGYGDVDAGRMRNMVLGLATALAAFMKDLGDKRSQVTVVTTSEFGRRVAENGAGGLDHGWGNAMLLLGAGIQGRTYHGQWPGLDTDRLADGDLRVTTDYRNVLAEVVGRTFPDRSVSDVFPGLVYRPLGVTTS